MGSGRKLIGGPINALLLHTPFSNSCLEPINKIGLAESDLFMEGGTSPPLRVIINPHWNGIIVPPLRRPATSPPSPPPNSFPNPRGRRLAFTQRPAPVAGGYLRLSTSPAHRILIVDCFSHWFQLQIAHLVGKLQRGYGQTPSPKYARAANDDPKLAFKQTVLIKYELRRQARSRAN